MKTLILATRNPGKVREFQTLLGPLGYEVVTAAQAGYHGDPEETGDTFRANAEIKARAVFEGTGGRHAVLSDDSGLSVDALGGAPGVYSARYAGPGGTDADNNAKLLREMEGKTERAARYQIALCLIEPGLLEPGRDPVFFEAACEGVIGLEERGTGGFGYDVLFFPVGEGGQSLGLTFAEMSAEEKHPLSHRGKAVKALVEFLGGDRGSPPSRG
jgi:non-canonical purine NTP pyrophosphatase (RdgB/HAM1 family)